MSLLLEPETTRAELTEALANLTASAKRTPSHWPAHAMLHADIDDILTALMGMS